MADIQSVEFVVRDERGEGVEWFPVHWGKSESEEKAKAVAAAEQHEGWTVVKETYYAYDEETVWPGEEDTDD